jgi:hypothetical protein
VAGPDLADLSAHLTGTEETYNLIDELLIDPFGQPENMIQSAEFGG